MKLDEFRESQEKDCNTCLVHQSPVTGNVFVLIDDTSCKTWDDLRVEVKRYVQDKDGRWAAGFLYAGNDYVCAMNAFQKCLNEAVAIWNEHVSIEEMVKWEEGHKYYPEDM